MFRSRQSLEPRLLCLLFIVKAITTDLISLTSGGVNEYTPWRGGGGASIVT